jgi:hypothetical protein
MGAQFSTPTDGVPAGFDTATCPVIARHWFGVEPFQPIGEVAVEVVAELALKRRVEHGVFVAERGLP